MARKINPFHQLLWLTPQTLQIGIGDSARVVEQVTSSEERLIDALYYGLPEHKVSPLAKILKLDSARFDTLLEHLEPLIITDDGSPTPAYSPGNLARASLVNQKAPSEVFRRRSHQSVRIQSLDATGLGLVLALAESGVGHLITPDTERVSEADCASNLYPRALLGYRRFQAAKLILDSSWPGTALHAAARVSRNIPKPALTVIVNHHVTDPNEVGRWLAAETPVLAIRYEAESCSVSPVLDGTEGCLNCEFHWKNHEDPHFAAVAAQLLGSQLRFDDSVSRQLCSGIALQKILRRLDGQVADHSHVTLTNGLDLKIEIAQWQQHPECSCGIRNQLQLAEAV